MARLACALLLLAGCDVLFQLRPVEPVPDVAVPIPPDSALPMWRAPQPLSSLNVAGGGAGAIETDASMTADTREIFFSSDRAGGMGFDIYRSTRTSTNEPFPTPVRVAELSSTSNDYGFISADGLSFYRSRHDSADVEVATRADGGSAFGAFVKDPGLSALTGASNVELSRNGLHAIANVNVAGNQELHLFSRLSPAAAWGSPRRLTEIASPAADGGGTFDEHGLTLIFHSERDAGERKLFITSRASVDDLFSFQATAPIVELNMPGGSDPWVAPDLRTIVFMRGDDLYLSTR